MALINCPECNGKVSDTAPSCPHCGYLLQQKTATSVDSLSSADERSSADTVKTSDVGEFKSRFAMRLFFIVFGLLTIFCGIFFFPLLFLGCFFLGLCLVYSDVADCFCPYCGAKGSYSKKSLNYRCPACQKTSVYDKENNQLKTVR